LRLRLLRLEHHSAPKTTKTTAERSCRRGRQVHGNGGSRKVFEPASGLGPATTAATRREEHRAHPYP
jgi:hypothetical protein